MSYSVKSLLVSFISSLHTFGSSCLRSPMETHQNLPFSIPFDQRLHLTSMMASPETASSDESSIGSQDSSAKPSQVLASDVEGEVRSSRSPPTDDLDDTDVEETIMTPAALSASRSVKPKKQDVQLYDAGQDESEPEESPEPIRPKRQVGFSAPEELPKWFPKKIRNIYEVDRHGGALSFKELNVITKYRNLMEITHRRQWRKYLKAGEARWKLQKILRRQDPRSSTEAFHEYRKKQFKLWQAKALKTWKKLEKIHRGTLILDDTININFRQERMIYAKQLRSSM